MHRLLKINPGSPIVGVLIIKRNLNMHNILFYHLLTIECVIVIYEKKVCVSSKISKEIRLIIFYQAHLNKHQETFVLS